MDDDLNLSMKLLIDLKGRRVLFAEAGKDVVDFLFSFLSLPLGAVTSYHNPKQMVWSIGNLYQSIQDLRDLHLIPNKNIEFLEDLAVMTSTTITTTTNSYSPLSTTTTTTNSNSPLILLSTDCSEQSSPTKKSYYRCSKFVYLSCRAYVTLNPKSRCPLCSFPMSSPLTVVGSADEGSSSSSSSSSSIEGGGFVKGGVSYMITDDLVVKPMSSISTIALVNSLNFREVGALKEKMINLTIDEVGELLMASLQSKNVLTNVFFEEIMAD